MNNNAIEKLQYNEIKEMLKSFCVSGLGKNLIDKLTPESNMKIVKTRLQETSEGRNILDIYSYVPLEGISNINKFIEKIEKGMVLECDELNSFSDFFRGCTKIKQFMINKEDLAPLLSSYSNSIVDFKSIEDEINLSIKGNRVDSSASKELKRIRRLIDVTEEKIEEKLSKFLKNDSNKKYIQEFFISKRNGRYTIPIKSSYKNFVEGSIVESSSKGTTIFMEPKAIGKLSQELIVLKSDEAIEEYQILATLTGIILEKIKDIKINKELIAQYDMIFSKAKYSKSIKGIEPKINNYGYIKLIKCKHPLLRGNVVPLDFEVGDNYRTLIITGPNAGGKTVVLKTLGLLTLLVQSGIHIEGEKGSEIAIFDKIFVDIGDDQSLENALSTFSSHMKNLSAIMKESNRNTLLLFDEIGSGTEPSEGAALAISILEEFYHMGCITVATTHYGEIKRFSEKHSDFENAAMKFNKETLEPLYKLVIGKAGNSNAIWISRKMGISEKVLERAQNYMKKREYNFNLVKESKVKKASFDEQETNKENFYEYKKGDKVLLLDYNYSGIVYEEIDENNNLKIFVNNDILEVNYKRIKLEIKASNLYPEDYDLNTIFQEYKERKLEKDIKRGSKKALKKIQKEIKKHYI
ncbi:endonuclease MutS2 [Clostridium ihumii]|uniref:endonuclease MutS2 n=1 Tax=Clostridium ihumii TaxID=1470356 RepID=UPI003D35585E